MALTLFGTVSDNELILSRHNSKPLIINGDMNIFQRGTSVTSVTSNGVKVADRMYFEYGSLGTWTIAQSTDVPTGQGFKYSQKYDCTTADASPASGDYLLPIEYHFEGQDLQLLKKGTSSAEPITVAVWLKSNLTGNFNLEIWDRENDRQISSALNITSANTWTKFVKTFAGDTTGTLSADSSHRFSIGIWGDSGSDFRGGTLQTSWGAKTNANRAEGNVNLGNSTDNELLVCGLQMEIGSFDENSMPPFQHDDIGTSLARCQRYFGKYKADGTTGSHEAFCYSGFASSSTATEMHGNHPSEMRASPTITFTSGTVFRVGQSASDQDTTSITADMISTHSARIKPVVSSGLTSGQGVTLLNKANTTAEIFFDSEL